MSQLRRMWWDCKFLILSHPLLNFQIIYLASIYTSPQLSGLKIERVWLASNIYIYILYMYIYICVPICHTDIYPTTLSITTDVQIMIKYRVVLVFRAVAVSHYFGIKCIAIWFHQTWETHNRWFQIYLTSGLSYMITDADKISKFFDAAYMIRITLFVPHLF